MKFLNYLKFIIPIIAILVYCLSIGYNHFITLSEDEVINILINSNWQADDDSTLVFFDDGTLQAFDSQKNENVTVDYKVFVVNRFFGESYYIDSWFGFKDDPYKEFILEDNTIHRTFLDKGKKYDSLPIVGINPKTES